MERIEPHYVDFNTAKWLKEKRFDESCNMVWDDWNNLEDWVDEGLGTHRNSNKNASIYYSAPEQWLVVEWLRVNHGIHVTYEWDYSYSSEREYYFYKIKFKGNDGFIKLITGESVSSPQEAYSTSFDYIKENNLI